MMAQGIEGSYLYHDESLSDATRPISACVCNRKFLLAKLLQCQKKYVLARMFFEALSPYAIVSSELTA
jgi:hypothetical protein